MHQDISQRLADIKKRISTAAENAGRDPGEIALVAVGKTQPIAAIREAVQYGAGIIGENYIQEARDKYDALGDLEVRWHFIGHLQSNKAKYAVCMFDLIHSVDSVKLARELDKQAAKIAKRQDILIQVNISGEVTKWGAAGDEAEALIQQIAALENLRILGLMTMPPYFDAPDKARPYFAALRRLAERVNDKGMAGVTMSELSMGMTGDFEAAIEEGATLVRIGTAIFGARR